MTNQLKTEPVKCNLCGSDDTELICLNHDRIHNIAGEYRSVRCRKCGLIYLNPRPTSESLPRYYPENYGPYKGAGTPPLRAGFLKSVLKPVYDLITLKALLDRLEVKNTVSPSLVALNRSTRMLDVGCATGTFLKKCRDTYGCEIHGIDISAEALKYAHEKNGVATCQGDFLSNNFPDGYFDLVTMWWALEHTQDPRKVLTESRRILKKSGSVVIGVPNGNSLGRWLFREKWYAYDVPRHLYVFSPETITRLLQETGFEILAIKHDYSTWDLLGSLQYLFFGEKYLPGKKIGDIQSSKIAQILMMPFGLLQGILKISGTMVIYARKSLK